MLRDYLKLQYGIAAVALLGVGIFVGWELPHAASGSTVGPLRQSDLTAATHYHFIDPLIGIKGSDTRVSTQYQPLQKSVENFIATDLAETVSVNFRDFDVSEGFVINPDEKYTPASLFKVPTMMTYFKLALDNPNILAERLVYRGPSRNTKESITSPVQLEQGYSYSVEELIEHMIKNSDNNAANMLGNYLNTIGDGDAANTLVRDLGITQIEYAQDFITIRAYTLFFRVLYNSTYLSRGMSEKALGLLSETDFNAGLTAPLPKGIVVAHKFGEFSLLNTEGVVLERELHDCGIIYYPGHPYLLCVMTKGSDFASLEKAISGISKTVFEFVKNKYPPAQ